MTCGPGKSPVIQVVGHDLDLRGQEEVSTGHADWTGVEGGRLLYVHAPGGVRR